MPDNFKRELRCYIRKQWIAGKSAVTYNNSSEEQREEMSDEKIDKIEMIKQKILSYVR